MESFVCVIVVNKQAYTVKSGISISFGLVPSAHAHVQILCEFNYFRMQINSHKSCTTCINNYFQFDVGVKMLSHRLWTFVFMEIPLLYHHFFQYFSLSSLWRENNWTESSWNCFNLISLLFPLPTGDRTERKEHSENAHSLSSTNDFNRTFKRLYKFETRIEIFVVICACLIACLL